MHIGFSTTDKIASRLIRWLTRSKVSHTFIRFKIAGEDVVLHATSHGVNLDYYPKFAKKNKIVEEYMLKLTDSDTNKVISGALKKLDRPYDYLSIMGFFWVLVAKSFRRRVKNPFPNRSAYFCSELVAKTLGAIEFPGAKDLDYELTSPEDLMEFMANHKDVYK